MGFGLPVEFGDDHAEGVEGFVEAGVLLGDLVVVAPALAGIPGPHELGQRFEDLPFPSFLGFELLPEPLHERIVPDVLLLAPLACLGVKKSGREWANVSDFEGALSVNVCLPHVINKYIARF